MKKRKLTLLNTLAEEIEKSSFHSVSVTTICDKIGCSRQNFYYYFDSIEEAIKDLLDNDIAESDSINFDPLVLKSILTVMQKRQKFYEVMFSTPSSKSVMCQILMDKMSELYSRWIPYLVRDFSFLPENKKYPLARQFAFSDLALVTYWAEGGFQKPIEEIFQASVLSSTKELQHFCELYIENIRNASSTAR